MKDVQDKNIVFFSQEQYAHLEKLQRKKTCHVETCTTTTGIWTLLILGVKVSSFLSQPDSRRKCEKQEPGTMLLLIHAAFQTNKTARAMESSLTAFYLLTAKAAMMD